MINWAAAVMPHAAYLMLFALTLMFVVHTFVVTTAGSHLELFDLHGFWTSIGEATWSQGIMSEGVLGPEEQDEFKEHSNALGLLAGKETDRQSPDLRDDLLWRVIPAAQTPLFALRDYLQSVALPRHRRAVRAAVQSAYVSVTSSEPEYVWDIMLCTHRPGSAWGYCGSMLVIGTVGSAARRYIDMQVINAASLGVLSEGNMTLGPNRRAMPGAAPFVRA